MCVSTHPLPFFWWGGKNITILGGEQISPYVYNKKMTVLKCYLLDAV